MWGYAYTYSVTKFIQAYKVNFVPSNKCKYDIYALHVLATDVEYYAYMTSFIPSFLGKNSTPYYLYFFKYSY